MIEFEIRVSVDQATWEKVTEDEWQLLRSLVEKLGCEAEIPSAEDIATAEKLARAIADCPMSARARNALTYYAYPSIDTVGDLVEKSESDVRHMKKIGSEAYREIIDFLASQGLSLKTSLPKRRKKQATE